MNIKIYTLQPQLLYESVLGSLDRDTIWAKQNAADGFPRFYLSNSELSNKVILYAIPMDTYLGILTQHWSGTPTPSEEDCGLVVSKFLEFLMKTQIDKVSKIEINK